MIQLAFLYEIQSFHHPRKRVKRRKLVSPVQSSNVHYQSRDLVHSHTGEGGNTMNEGQKIKPMLSSHPRAWLHRDVLCLRVHRLPQFNYHAVSEDQAKKQNELQNMYYLYIRQVVILFIQSSDQFKLADVHFLRIFRNYSSKQVHLAYCQQLTMINVNSKDSNHACKLFYSVACNK